MTEPENLPRERATQEDVQVPEGAELMPDGSFVYSDQAVEVPAEETDEEREQREQIAQAQRETQDAMLSEQAEAQLPREQGTDVNAEDDER